MGEVGYVATLDGVVVGMFVGYVGYWVYVGGWVGWLVVRVGKLGRLAIRHSSGRAAGCAVSVRVKQAVVGNHNQSWYCHH